MCLIMKELGEHWTNEKVILNNTLLEQDLALSSLAALLSLLNLVSLTQILLYYLAYSLIVL
jgi:hypothetical protein